MIARFIIAALLVLAGWMYWKLRVARFQEWLCIHAVRYLIDSEDITEEQYYGALRIAEARCDQLKILGFRNP